MREVVYMTDWPELARAARRHLLANGLHAESFRPPRKWPATDGPPTQYLVVPSDEVSRARAALATLDKIQSGRVVAIVRDIRTQAWRAAAVAIPLALLLVAWIVGPTRIMARPCDSLMALTAVALIAWAPCFVAFSRLAERRRRNDPSRRYRCECCQYPLVGLEQARCPECAQPFDQELLEEMRRATQGVEDLFAQRE